VPNKKNTIAKVGYEVVSFPGRGSPNSIEPLLTTQEVAALLRCSASSLNKWRLTGRGPPFVYVGHRVRYRPSAIATYVAEQTRSSTSATSASEDVPAE
jgi:hypothetical protein